MSEMETVKPIPAPPAEITDADQIAAGEERWEHCPMNDCKRKPELLYSDFYLRDIRTNRLMCSACAVRIEVGYISREVAKAYDDKFFTGTRLDYLSIFFTSFVLSFLANSVFLFTDFWIIAIFVGFGAGWLINTVAKRFTGGRVARYGSRTAIGAVILGFLLSPPVIMVLLLLMNVMLTLPADQYSMAGFLTILMYAFLPQFICTGVLIYLVRNIFRR